jgi:hypothetical protein
MDAPFSRNNLVHLLYLLSNVVCHHIVDNDDYIDNTNIVLQVLSITFGAGSVDRATTGTAIETTIRAREG